MSRYFRGKKGDGQKPLNKKVSFHKKLRDCLDNIQNKNNFGREIVQI